MLVWNRVAVLLEEAVDLVRDFERVVGDRERGRAEPGLLKHLGVGRGADGRVELLDKVRVGPGRQSGLLVEEGQDPELAFDQVDRRLVVRVVDEGPVNLLPDVLLLLELENVCVELLRVEDLVSDSAFVRVGGEGTDLLLELLVRVVDAELLKAVSLEVLEAVDVL